MPEPQTKSMPSSVNWDRILQATVIALQFLLCAYLTYILPMNHAPDEGMRYSLAYWIFKHNALPIGTETEIVNTTWGFSYAFTPYLPSMLAWLPMKLVSLFTTSETALRIAARSISVCSVCGCTFLCFRIGNELFTRKTSRYLFAVLTAFLPQVIFLGSYHNNDAFSLFSCFLILYFLVSGRKTHWKITKCIGLGIGMSLSLLTYYYGYGWILISIVFCIWSCMRDKNIENKGAFILQRAAVVAGVVLLCAGWYFIRNGIIYNGDILGMAASDKFQQTYALTHTIHPGTSAQTKGHTLLTMLLQGGWIYTTLRSFIGTFGYMNVCLRGWMYLLYCLIIGIGISGALLAWIRKRKSSDNLLICTLIAAAIIPVIISIYGSYWIDYSPQGRYIITALPCLALAITAGFETLSTNLQNRCRVISPAKWYHGLLRPDTILAILLPVLCCWIYLSIMLPGLAA